MAELFGRKCVIAVDTKEFTGLRAQFEVTKTGGKEPNTLDLKIWNLSEASRSNMQKKGAKVIVQAGYENQFSQVFSGNARTIDHVRQGPDWVTHIQCGDGEVAYSFARVSESFAPGVSVQSVASFLIGKLGLAPGNSAAKLSAINGALTQFVHGYSCHGLASQELARLMASVGLEFSIQDGAVQILGGSETTTDEFVVLGSSTGMVGSPEHGTPDKKGKPSSLKVKALLNPALKPGRKVRVQALQTKGDFKVTKCVHKGDTAGGDWYSEIECLPL